MLIFSIVIGLRKTPRILEVGQKGSCGAYKGLDLALIRGSVLHS